MIPPRPLSNKAVELLGDAIDELLDDFETHISKLVTTYELPVPSFDIIRRECDTGLGYVRHHCDGYLWRTDKPMVFAIIEAVYSELTGD